MFLTEWKHVLHTKGLLKIILGILLVPSFYAVIFLASLWNPYANVRHLPVGVVNQDVPVTKADRHYQLGTKLTQQLVHNHSADFHQLTMATAQHQLKTGKIYMVITIPHQFSSQATTLGSAHPHAINLHDQTNAGFSFIAMKMNTTTATKIQTAVEKQLTTSYLQTMGHDLRQSGHQLTTASHALAQTTTGLRAIATGNQTEATDLQQTTAGTAKLAHGLNQFKQGLATAQPGFAKLTATDTALQTAMTTQNQALQQLKQALATAQPNLRVIRQQIDQLQAANRLKSAKLVAMNRQLTQQLAQGNQQAQTALTATQLGLTHLQTADTQLTAGSTRLTSGTQQVTTGNQKITTALKTGGQQLTTTGRRTTRQADLTVNPIKLSHYDATHVQNNGTGMAPYLMSVALFVGCITFNIIYDMFTPHRRPKTAGDWWAQKIPFLFEFTGLAATVMFVLLGLINHLNPLEAIRTYAFCLLTVWTFASIVTYFNLILGKTGAWLMLIFMIIQLGGSAGTYPIQLSNSFFQTLHPYLPMSISIDAFRSTLSIGNSIWPEITIFVGLIIVFNLLMLLTFHVNLPKLNQRLS